MRPDMLDGKKCSLHIDCHEPVPFGFRRFLKWLHQHDSGIVEENIDSFPAGDRIRHDLADNRFMGDICTLKDCFPALGNDLLDCLFASAPVHIDGDYTGSFTRKSNGACQTNSAGRSRNDRYFSIKLHSSTPITDFLSYTYNRTIKW